MSQRIISCEKEVSHDEAMLKKKKEEVREKYGTWEEIVHLLLIYLLYDFSKLWKVFGIVY